MDEMSFCIGWQVGFMVTKSMLSRRLGVKSRNMPIGGGDSKANKTESGVLIGELNLKGHTLIQVQYVLSSTL